MKKKVLATMLFVLMVFGLAACGDSESPQNSDESGVESGWNADSESSPDSENENVEGETNDGDETGAFSETLTFMGFNLRYPEGIKPLIYKYGYILRYNTDITVMVEAPATAAVWLDVADIHDTAAAVEECVIETLEEKVDEIFDRDATTQTITNSEIKTINDIEMLRVEGFFTNTNENVDAPFVGYYFLVDANVPVYFIGVSLNENASVDSFMDEFAGSTEDIREQLMQERQEKERAEEEARAAKPTGLVTDYLNVYPRNDEDYLGIPARQVYYVYDADSSLLPHGDDIKTSFELLYDYYHSAVGIFAEETFKYEGTMADALEDIYSTDLFPSLASSASHGHMSNHEITVTSTEETTIGGKDCLKFTGTVVTEHYEEWDSYVYGYVFVFDGMPCAVMGVVSDDEQDPDMIAEMEAQVEQIASTLRLEE